MNCSKSAHFRDMCDECQRFDLFNMINDPLLLINSQNGTILFMNQKALEMYQYTIEEAVELSINQISHDSAALISENMNFTKQSTKGYIFTASHSKKDGSIFKVEVSARHMKLHGTEIFASVVRNLTPDLKMREEVEQAGKVQRRLLPRDLNEKLFSIHSVYQPYNYVSGDLYDFVFEDSKQVLYGIIIDVMGHGIATAFQTSILKYLFTRVIKKNIPINDKMAWINQEVMPLFTDGDFAGVFLFEIDFNSNRLTYSAGGINYFILIKGHGPEVVKVPGLFLGIHANEVFDQGSYYFQSGESFCFLTDGLFELISQHLDSNLDFWGMQELCKLLTSKGNGRDDAAGVGIIIR